MIQFRQYNSNVFPEIILLSKLVFYYYSWNLNNIKDYLYIL